MQNIWVLLAFMLVQLIIDGAILMWMKAQNKINQDVCDLFKLVSDELKHQGNK